MYRLQLEKISPRDLFYYLCGVIKGEVRSGFKEELLLEYDFIP